MKIFEKYKIWKLLIAPFLVIVFGTLAIQFLPINKKSDSAGQHDLQQAPPKSQTNKTENNTFNNKGNGINNNIPNNKGFVWQNNTVNYNTNNDKVKATTKKPFGLEISTDGKKYFMPINEAFEELKRPNPANEDRHWKAAITLLNSKGVINSHLEEILSILMNKNEAPFIRAIMVAILGNMGDAAKDAVPFLSEMLLDKSETYGVRNNIPLTLFSITQDKDILIPIMLESLKDKTFESQSRGNTPLIIAELKPKDKATILALEQLHNSETDSFVKEKISLALNKIRNNKK